jgi:hypothetical protein
MKYAWFILLMITAKFGITAIEYPPIDGDLAWQRWLGSVIATTHHIPRALGNEVYTAMGASWTPQEWLFSLFALWGTQGTRWDVFAFGVALCAVGAIFLTTYRAKLRGAAPMDLAIVAMLTGISMMDAFGVRAQVVAWLMLALFLVVLDCEGPLLWLLVPIAALWSNVHASAILAPIFTAMVALARYVEDRALTRRAKLLIAVFPLVALAICLNPFGIGLPLYAMSLFGSPITKYISEWRATDVGFYSFSLGSLPILIAGVIIGVRSREKSRNEDVLFFTICTFLMFFAARNIPIFAICVAPIVAANIKNAFPQAREKEGRAISPYALPALAAVLILVVVMRLHTNPHREDRPFPDKEIATLKSMKGEYRVFCSNFAWSSYFLGSSNVRVFLDGRSDPYPLPVWQDFAVIAFVKPNWQSVLDARRVNAIIDARDSDLDQAVALSKKWRDASHDDGFRLWIR